MYPQASMSSAYFSFGVNDRPAGGRWIPQSVVLAVLPVTEPQTGRIRPALGTG